MIWPIISTASGNHACAQALLAVAASVGRAARLSPLVSGSHRPLASSALTRADHGDIGPGLGVVLNICGLYLRAGPP
jgi:hypothetical protein